MRTVNKSSADANHVFVVIKIWITFHLGILGSPTLLWHKGMSYPWPIVIT